MFHFYQHKETLELIFKLTYDSDMKEVAKLKKLLFTRPYFFTWGRILYLNKRVIYKIFSQVFEDWFQSLVYVMLMKNEKRAAKNKLEAHSLAKSVIFFCIKDKNITTIHNF
jgi:hypothetical protein